MSICIDRFRETVTPPNALMSLMSGKEMRFQVPPVKRSDSTAGSRNESGSEFRTVGAPLSAKSTSTKPRNIQFATAGRTEMLAAGNFGDWHAAVGEVPWSSAPKTPMNSHGKLVLHPLWNRQPVQKVERHCVQ